MGIIKNIDAQTVSQLMLLIQPAYLQKSAGKVMEKEERDTMRAKIIRDKLTYSSTESAEN